MGKIYIGICEDEKFFREEMEKMISVYANESESDIEMGCYDVAVDISKDILENHKQCDLFCNIKRTLCVRRFFGGSNWVY